MTAKIIAGLGTGLIIGNLCGEKVNGKSAEKVGAIHG